MIKKLSFIIPLILCLQSFGQDLTATIKTVDAVQPGNDFIVEITVNKPGINGFVKYFQSLPNGYSATDIDCQGGNFTFADNGAKIIWVSPPVSDQFVMSYKISVPSTATGTLPIGGKFQYVVANERKTFDVTEKNILIGNGVVNNSPVDLAKEAPKETSPSAEIKTVPAETKSSNAEEKPVVTENKKVVPVEDKSKTETKPTPVELKKEKPVITAPVNKIPATAAAFSEAGKTYRVQIGAFSQKPHLESVPESSSLLLENGMTKYFTGNFKTYEEAAKRKKEMIQKGFPGAFVVSFENGKIVK